jgi:hypothetical protein
MKGEHMDNFILTLRDICVTETQVYTEQHQVPEDIKEEGILTGRYEMAVFILNKIKIHLQEMEDKNFLEYLEHKENEIPFNIRNAIDAINDCYKECK